MNSKSGNNDLVIVESPTKARTLTRYLGKGYRVLASGGHIIDLPPKKFGVDIDKNFKPEYELLRGRKKIADTLAIAARESSSVYLATDPDREGEAIAWHISRYIAPSFKGKILRVQFHEITKKAILESLKVPGDIDKNKVDAQQARRVMDRIVGYKVSPLLWKTVARGLSAGRVQSVALRLICEREAEIDVFVPIEYWTIDGNFKGENIEPFIARLTKLDGNKIEIPSKKEVDQIVKRLKATSYSVIDIKKTQKKRSPYPPYITSTLQQDAGRRLGFTVKRTMSIAQQLYEGVELGSKGQTGLITYMRTDSIRVSNEAITSARDWVASNLTPEHLTATPRVFKNKKGKSQDAHEAIRPTDVSLTPEKVKNHLTPEQFKLYDLIWRRFVATQMKEAVFNVTTVIIGDGKGIEFNASGQTLMFSGFLTIYADVKNNGNEENNIKVPKGLRVKMSLELLKLDPAQHFTQPPPRYTEAGLVKELDELGIGRPSTYSSIISTLIDRKYVDREKRSFFPTELGKTVNSILVASFPDIFNVKFTADMEEQLDNIETGGKWQTVLDDFYRPFNEALLAVEGRKDELKKTTMQPVGRNCPECGEELMYRWGKLGRFISCSGFPKCKYTENIEPQEPIEVKDKCPKCGGEMIVRDGRYGRFLGCKSYPECKGILPFTTGYKCPKDGCEGNIVERKSKKGRLFYGCDKYPDCKTTSWDPPAKGPCPECGAETIFEKQTKTGVKKTCLKCGWKGEE
ncbi:type I DNA topoisomerase [bacterium]|nr:type I DNA topoisomerase [bacterium]